MRTEKSRRKCCDSIHSDRLCQKKKMLKILPRSTGVILYRVSCVSISTFKSGVPMYFLDTTM